MQILPAMMRSALSFEKPEAISERVNGEWTPTSSSQLLRRIENVALGLRDRGLQTGDRVALIAPNRVDWVVADLGIIFAGLVAVPMFPTQALDNAAFILDDCGAKLIIVDTDEALARLRLAVPHLPAAIVMDGEGEESLRALEARGEAIREADPKRVGSFERELKPTDLAVLVYTSGTTGTPKGVMLSHDNIASNARDSAAQGLGAVTADQIALSVLPFSHIYEHTAIYSYIGNGVTYVVCRNPDDLLADLRAIRPTYLTVVPRILERVLAGIIARAKTQGAARARLVPWALGIGRDYMHAQTFGPAPSVVLRAQYALAHKLVLKRVRPMLGLDRLRFLVSGSAPLHPDIAMTFLALDLPVVEGYGTSECSPVVSVNTFERNRYGTVGRPIANVQLRIADDGEVLVKGPGVMLGYYKNPQANNEVFRDGWYCTGDIGEVDAEGYLKITDRKRELFKTSGGKFIAPSRVESAIKRSIYMNQVLVIGNGRTHPAALIAPTWDVLRKELDLPNATTEELAKNEKVRALVEHELAESVKDLADYEQIRWFALLPRDLTVENDELSPTLKVKRRVVEARFADLIESIYRTNTVAA